MPKPKITDSTPPTFRIKILRERRAGDVRKIQGASGLRYLFRWEVEAQAYVYTPESQAQVDDLFGTAGVLTVVHFAPISVPVSQGQDEVSEKKQEAEPPKRTDFEPPSVDDVDTCLLHGILVNEDDDAATVKRLIEIYVRGRRTGEMAGVKKGLEEAQQNAELNAKAAAAKATPSKRRKSTSHPEVSKPTTSGSGVGVASGDGDQA
tara:strand:- start:1269 stop:1886 length:618 start_codon:yes stop_codon:yes gene_type:complete